MGEPVTKRFLFKIDVWLNIVRKWGSPKVKQHPFCDSLCILWQILMALKAQKYTEFVFRSF